MPPIGCRCVVNDFTSLDQRYLDKLTRNLQNSKKDFREVIVVHNCKEVIDEDTLRYVWETQVTAIYGSGTPQTTLSHCSASGGALRKTRA